MSSSVANQGKVCKQCGATEAKNNGSGCYRGKWYCSSGCMHDAGDRSCCHRHCGCSRYGRKRRQLREHRAEMRIMEGIIESCGQKDEMERLIIEETGNTGYWLGYDSDSMDEDSNGSDPEVELKAENKALRAEASDRERFVGAVADTLKVQALALNNERLRMQLEDLTSRAQQKA